MAGKIVKNLISVAFIPFIVAVTKAFYFELTGVKALTTMSRYFFCGVVAYVIMYIVFFKMDYLYVAGHEFVHAIFVWIFGGKIFSFKVSKKGGSVKTNKSNTFIELAPYFVPIHAILVLALYLFVDAFWRISSSERYFIFLVGFAFSFHIVMTIDKTKIEQPDFLRLGYWNSLVLVYIINFLVIGILLGSLLPDFSFKNFSCSFITITKDIYVSIFNQLFVV
ncbi:MAG: hypothetical protein COS99_05920 [Candidatus Omnitrophica bacterium CG07_land_8_20_14_0_80_42_15]|uniref:Uncharacterized protein n=1 Tax=Candidatus Aquitaenariimonas noxiae TaxID=1974741 RepID=A0A2J0L2B4_9BACT|nr:MAG: hypothetical protein COS99_05920 [Candidatus Omnitrophica bacterium CG07_land_8_20_14_0_80_42_15]